MGQKNVFAYMVYIVCLCVFLHMCMCEYIYCAYIAHILESTHYLSGRFQKKLLTMASLLKGPGDTQALSTLGNHLNVYYVHKAPFKNVLKACICDHCNEGFQAKI